MQKGAGGALLLKNLPLSTAINHFLPVLVIAKIDVVPLLVYLRAGLTRFCSSLKYVSVFLLQPSYLTYYLAYGASNRLVHSSLVGALNLFW